MTSLKVIEENRRSATGQEDLCGCGCGCDVGLTLGSPSTGTREKADRDEDQSGLTPGAKQAPRPLRLRPCGCGG